MSCHCCPCDHSSTIRQYFSNINLWTNSKVSQLDRQSDESAGYHCDGEGCMIKEWRAPTQVLSMVLKPPFLLASVLATFFPVLFFFSFFEKKVENLFFFPALLAYRKSPGEFELQQFPANSKRAELFGSIHLSSAEASGHHSPLRHVTSWGRISPLLG